MHCQVQYWSHTIVNQSVFVAYKNATTLRRVTSKQNARKYERKHVWNKVWLFASHSRRKSEQPHQADGICLHTSVRPVHCILQWFRVDLEKTLRFPPVEILPRHREQWCLVHFDTARRADWKFDGIVVLYCGKPQRKAGMGESFDRIQTRRRKNSKEN